ncbi:MAG: type II toxin-antitoxin system ParD family antitoxin [Pyrinomonadaceae bacterium]|nr:type II toxin-antitoxin system ParD family antitoxin [Pyrinomonadaceae bacterium]
MNVSLTKELESFISNLVASGMYYSASEVVRDGLRLLKEQEELKQIRLKELKAEIMLGVEDLNAGRSQSFYTEEDIFQEVKKRGQKKLEAKRNGK